MRSLCKRRKQTPRPAVFGRGMSKQIITTYDVIDSLWLATAVEAKPLRCWRNAALAVVRFPDVFVGGSYIEGWIVLPRSREIILVEHAWCTLSDNRRLDPSLVLVEKPAQPVFFFAGLEIASADLLSRIQGQTLPLVCHSDYGEDGMQHPGYRQAYLDAWDAARRLAEAAHLSEEAIIVGSRNDQNQELTLFPLS
jgi:hypothetical protein